MADFRPFSPRWGDISFTEAPQTTARCYAGVIFLSYSPSGRHREPAGVEGAARHGAWPRCRWAAAGPGRASARPHTKCRRCRGRRSIRRAWLRCRWVAAGPGRASRSTTPSLQARVWRSRGRAAAHGHTEQPGPAGTARNNNPGTPKGRVPKYPPPCRLTQPLPRRGSGRMFLSPGDGDASTGTCRPRRPLPGPLRRSGRRSRCGRGPSSAWWPGRRARRNRSSRR